MKWLRHPVKTMKEKAMDVMLKRFLGKAIRHGLTALGGAGLAVSDNEVELLASAAAFVVGLALSYVRDRVEKKATA